MSHYDEMRLSRLKLIECPCPAYWYRALDRRVVFVVVLKPTAVSEPAQQMDGSRTSDNVPRCTDKLPTLVTMSVRAARRRSQDLMRIQTESADLDQPDSPGNLRSPRSPFWTKVTSMFSPNKTPSVEHTEEKTSFYQAVYAQVVGNLATLGALALAYFVWLLFEAYLYALIWAFVISVALFPIKHVMITSTHKVWAFSRSTHARYYCRALLGAAFAYGAYEWLGGTAPMAPMTLMIVMSFMLFLTMLARPVHYYVLGDHTFFAIVLLVSTVVSLAVGIVFFSVKIQSEFAEASYSVATWLNHTMAQEEISGVNVTEQVLNVRNMALTQLQNYQDSLNGTHWAPALGAVYNHLEARTRAGENLANVAQNWLIDTTNEETYSIRGFVTMAWHDVSQSDHLQQSLKSAGVNVAEVVLGAVGSMVGFSMILLGLGTQAVLFCTVLFYALSNEQSPLKSMFHFMPVPEVQRLALLEQMEKSIERVMFLPVVVALFNSMIGLGGIMLTNAYFGVDMKFKFFCTFLITIFSMVPIVQPYLVPVPWAIALVLGGKYVVAAVFFGGVYTVMTWADTWVYEGSAEGIHPYFTALSIVLGLSAFGMSGVVIGPLLLCAVRIIDDQVKAADTPQAAPTSTRLARGASVWETIDIDQLYADIDSES